MKNRKVKKSIKSKYYKNLILAPLNLLMIISIFGILALTFVNKRQDAVIKVTAEEVNFNLLNKDDDVSGVEFLIAPLKLNSLRLESFTPCQFKVFKMVCVNTDTVMANRSEVKIQSISPNASIVFLNQEQPISLQSLYAPSGSRFEVLSKNGELQINFPEITKDKQFMITGLITVGDQFFMVLNDCIMTDESNIDMYFPMNSKDTLNITASKLSYDIEFEFTANNGTVLARLCPDENNKLVLAENLLVENIDFLQKDITSSTKSTTISAKVEQPNLQKVDEFPERYEFKLQPDKVILEELEYNQNNLIVSLKEKFSKIQPIRENIAGKEILPSWLEYIYEKFQWFLVVYFVGALHFIYTFLKRIQASVSKKEIEKSEKVTI